MPPVLLRWLENHLLAPTKGLDFLLLKSRYLNQTFADGFRSLRSEESFLTDQFVHVFLARKKKNIYIYRVDSFHLKPSVFIGQFLSNAFGLSFIAEQSEESSLPFAAHQARRVTAA